MSRTNKSLVPLVPCHNITDLDQWKQYTSDMNTISSDDSSDLFSAFQRCIQQNGSECYAKESCTNDLFGNIGGALADPVCRNCLLQSPECKSYSKELSRLGEVIKVLRNPIISTQDVQQLIQSQCNIRDLPDLATVQKIADVLNDVVRPSQLRDESASSSSPSWVSQQTWIIIGAVAFVMFAVGVWVYSKKSQLSRHS